MPDDYQATLETRPYALSDPWYKPGTWVDVLTDITVEDNAGNLVLDPFVSRDGVFFTDTGGLPYGAILLRLAYPYDSIASIDTQLVVNAFGWDLKHELAASGGDFAALAYNPMRMYEWITKAASLELTANLTTDLRGPVYAYTNPVAVSTASCDTLWVLVEQAMAVTGGDISGAKVQARLYQ